MAWEREREILERNLEAMTALQREFIDAVLRVAEQYDMNPTELAIQVSQMSHSMFQPLHQLHAEQMQQRHMEMMRAQDQPEPPPKQR